MYIKNIASFHLFFQIQTIVEDGIHAMLFNLKNLSEKTKQKFYSVNLVCLALIFYTVETVVGFLPYFLLAPETVVA